MRNRSNTPPKDESAFINGGSAGLGLVKEIKTDARSKAKPVSISFAVANLNSIDNCIRDEMNNSGTRVNRSDIVRAAIMKFENLNSEERSELIKKAKLQ
ncbi:hypothetical protein PRCB_13255 [Pantoea rodasii]|uniref:Uncharacterized protein n=1 Tax=Pantoea rodasii TaxID=1076549 RepID=A0A2M9WBY7_9GAMM|nr:hypothetical protein [Pantoea rodasii]ORM59854.1 hypothetical protein HA45_22410 [Pantoea rodasii]PJZ05055.1 hypothetical protein PRCB_13255 [Pantoea rodasii]